ncbi:MAG: M20 family peptidase [Hyphomicrobiales bacterium]|nr:MAG: M20 family peptidase [Hyphomicrobiales bacterium]
MTFAEQANSAIKRFLDVPAAIERLRDAVRIDTITGNEANIIPFFKSEFEKLGLEKITVRDFLPGRPNLWGTLRGTGGGRKVLIVGHTDTVHVRGWTERWAGDERESPFGGAVIDGQMWGRGASDLKAGLCTGISALATLNAAGTVLKGDVTLAFVGDEESGEPGSGISAGMRALVAAIKSGEVDLPDFAIYVEPTTLDVYPAHMGFMIVDITVTGRTSYVGVPEKGVDALKATNAILSALWELSDRLDRAGNHDLVGRSFILVTSIEGGGYIAVPGECKFSLLRKLRPGESLDVARTEIESAVAAADLHPEIRVSFDYPAGRNHPLGGTPFDGDPTHAAVVRLAEAVKSVRPDRGRIVGGPFWSEAPFLAELGIPTAYFAPGDIQICHGLEERVSLEEYRDGISALSAFLADYCG